MSGSRDQQARRVGMGSLGVWAGRVAVLMFGALSWVFDTEDVVVVQ
jgi:hypothetical protein